MLSIVLLSAQAAKISRMEDSSSGRRDCLDSIQPFSRIRAASAGPEASGRSPREPTAPRALDDDELEALLEGFRVSAANAYAAGFDAVELHAAHGYAFSEFLSPGWNFRDDEYGGSPENRARLLCETIRACKQRAGRDFTIWCRIDAHEFGEPPGTTIELAQSNLPPSKQWRASAEHRFGVTTSKPQSRRRARQP